MSRAKADVSSVAGALLLLTAFAGAAACGSMGSDDSAPGRAGEGTSGGAPSPEKRPGDGAASAGSPSATGVVLVHAAAFPSFRLCFENSPELLPQPDSKVMPEANVVGVEVGSAVRINPIKAPGKIYVINEKAIRSTAGDPTAVPCGELLGNGSRGLIADNDYHVASTIDQPLGDNQVHVLAITGCGSKAFLTFIGATEDYCNQGTSRPWSSTSGNLEARFVPLSPSSVGATKSTLPVQLLHVAPALQAQLGTATLDVTFGDLGTAGPLPQKVASKTDLLKTSDPVTLDLDQTKEAVYGTHGFRIALREAGGATKFAIDQSLAAIQDLSSPSDVPTTYYQTPSNYALLLLGDPSVSATLDGGAPNPDRRRVHLLAVPVLDPSQLTADAGEGSIGSDAAAP